MMDVRKMASMGQRAMRAQQSVAEKVFWPMQAGRPREFKPSLLEAVLAGRQTANKLYAAMREAKLDMSEGSCVLVCVKDGKLAGLVPFASENEEMSDLEIVQKYLLRAKWDPIGIAFMLWDRDQDKVSALGPKLLMHTRLFERTEENERIMSAVHEKWAKDLRAGKMGKVRSN